MGQPQMIYSNQRKLELIIVNYISTFNVDDKLIAERQLSDVIGVSRQKLREVMMKLIAKGIITKSHGKETVLAKDVFGSEEHF